jgi:hypothetical protein
MMTGGDFVRISPFRRSANGIAFDLVAVSLVIVAVESVRASEDLRYAHRPPMSPDSGMLGRLSVLSSGGSRKPAQEQSNRDQITREIAALFITLIQFAFVWAIDRTEFPELSLSSTEDLLRNPLINLTSTGKFLMSPGMIDLYCESPAPPHLSIRP